MQGSPWYVLVWLAPWIGAASVLALHRAEGRVKGLVATASIGLSALASLPLVLAVSSTHGALEYSVMWVRSLDVSVGYYADGLSSLMALIVSWLSLLIAIYSLEYMEGDPGQTRYWFFFAFFVGSMEFLVLADNLLAMFIGWEGTGLASYALIGHWFTDEEDKWVGDPGRTALGKPMWFEPSHSGLRALVFTRLGDVGMLVGIAVIHIVLGTTSFEALAANPAGWVSILNSSGVLPVFLALFIMGALAKSAQIPFHEWLVTAMTGPTSVSALIHAATMVKAGVYLLLRMLPILGGAATALRTMNPAAYSTLHSFFVALAFIGGLTAFVLATMALVARELKLILAFSTASQLGYMFLGAAAGAAAGSAALGVFSGFSHLASHALFKASLFLAAGAVIHAVHSRFIDDMGGLARFMPLTFASMLLASLSLSGLPPFMGFWTKDSTLHAAEEAGLTPVFLLGAVTAVMTAAYSLRMVLRVFAYKPSERVEKHPPREPGSLMLVPYLALALASLIGGGLWPAVEESLASFLSEHTLGIGEKLHVEADPFLMLTSMLLVVLGLGTSLYIYHLAMVDPMRVVEKKPLLRRLHSFIYDRWLLNSIYYIVVVDGFKWLARMLHDGFNELLDKMYHTGIPGFFSASSAWLWNHVEKGLDTSFHTRLVAWIRGASGRVRRMQTGIVNHYILALWLGLSLAMIILMLVTGWWT